MRFISLAFVCAAAAVFALSAGRPSPPDAAAQGQPKLAAAKAEVKPVDRPVPAAEAPARMTVPDGFKVTLFAGEPDIVQPIALTFDERGRLWVVECLSYPNWTSDGRGGDRVTILEDADGDGRFDKRTVFYDKGANLTGIAVGFGGVWLCSTPNLVFIPDRNRDDVPDGPAEVVLDGWSLKAKHNVFNGLIWGPDGRLYGLNGITDTSFVGRPGAPADQRTALNCGVWRIHPVTRQFEAVAWGTTNPWGLDFDDFGEMFITNCVIEHVFHVVPGAHYKRMFGSDLNPHVYGLMQTCADHIHWGGGHWTDSRSGKGAHSDAGGGHAHSGCMVYLGDNWPDRYRNGVFTCNIHGNRVNHDVLERRGAGYVARHGRDFLHAGDPWFRGLAITYGPDGGVYVADWTDTGECHNYVVADRSNGRVYKVTYGAPKLWTGDLTKLVDRELIDLLRHKNDWFARQARRVLHERAAADKLEKDTFERLRKAALFRPGSDVVPETQRLRALWTLAAVEGLTNPDLIELAADPHEAVRAWAVRLAAEAYRNGTAPQARLLEKAADDPSPLVRLYAASALQRVPGNHPARANAALRLAVRADDASDAYLPNMIWYGIESLVPADRAFADQMLREARIPLIRENTARRLAALNEPTADGATPAGLALVIDALASRDDAALHRDLLRGLADALAGRRKMPLPAGWTRAYAALAQSPLAEVRERANALAVMFGDPTALTMLRKTAADSAAAPATRRSAVETLVFNRGTDVPELLKGLLNDPAVRAAAIRGLAAFADADTPARLLGIFPGLPDEEKADVVAALASRPAYAAALLDAVEAGKVARGDLSMFVVRQIAALGDKAVTDKLERVWGAVRPAATAKVEQIAKYKKLLTPAYLKGADRSAGRALFVKHCASCHKLFDEGGAIGPELTGSQRGNLDYVLENMIDPSAVVAREYQVTIVQTTDGRVLNGIVKSETERALTLQTPNEVVTVPKDEIAGRKQSTLSIMPEGVVEKMSDREIRDLAAYLASQSQVPLKK